MGLGDLEALEVVRSAVLETAFGDAQRPSGGMSVGVQSVSRVSFGFGAHRRARELVVQVRREGPAAADMRGEVVGSFRGFKGRYSEQGRLRPGRHAHGDAIGRGSANRIASSKRRRAPQRSAHRECLERCWVIRGKEGSKAGSRRLTLGEPLGLRPALRRAAATRCTPACGETALRFQVFALFLATLGVENPKSPHLIRLRPAFRGWPPPACGTLLAALVASVTSFALNDRLSGLVLPRRVETEVLWTRRAVDSARFHVAARVTRSPPFAHRVGCAAHSFAGII